jgi:hypothetical protein
LSRWVALISILAEYIDYSGSICVSRADRQYLWQSKKPPEDTWTIAACTSDAPLWRGKYRHFSLSIEQYSSVLEYHSAVAEGRPNNTQIASFGMGHIFFQVFVCPDLGRVSDYRAFLRRSGLMQLWPIPKHWLWPFTQRTSKFPSETVLDNDQANAIADAFHTRLAFLTQPPHFGKM